MQALARCLLEAEIEIDDTLYRVRVATMREAVVIFAALEAGDLDVAREVCRRWLPAGLFDRYYGSGSLESATLADLGELLGLGVVDSAKHKSDQELLTKEAARRSMTSLLADFADALHVPPMMALEMPWPLFVGLLAEVLRVQAARQADFMLAYGAARSGKETIWNDMLRRAGYLGAQSGTAEPFVEPEWMDDAWEQRQIARARAIGKTGEA